MNSIVDTLFVASTCILLFLYGCNGETGNMPVISPGIIALDSMQVLDTTYKIKGASLEMPRVKIGQKDIDGLKKINAEWVALIPFAFSARGEAEVHFGYSGQWWGETKEGIIVCANMAREAGLKVMIKPHVWVVGDGWPGKFDLAGEEEWLRWEETYREYILEHAEIADSVNADLYCIGTEYRIAVVKRPEFWKKLIREVREVYKGPLTYAANWDNYEKVKFWEDLDYIGVDAYFPVGKSPVPTMEELKEGWRMLVENFEELYHQVNRPILFTEFGYRNIEYGSAEHWKYKEETLATNGKVQEDAYLALFENVWQKPWMAGGFFWKWQFRSKKELGGVTNRRYTPQWKTAESVIADWYGK